MKALEQKQNWKILIFVRCIYRDHEESFELNASSYYRGLVWTKFWSRSTDYLRLIFFLDAKVEILKKVP